MRWLTVLVAALLVTGCADDGQELRAPKPGAVAPTVPVEPDLVPDASDRADFVFAAAGFDDGGVIPIEHTCDGADVSPGLTWDGVPFGAAELAITVTDPDAQFFTHWIITGLAPDTTGIAAGEVPAGAVQSLNSFGNVGWNGPCPPENHRYEFRLHVLPEPLGMVPDLDAPVAAGLVESATIQALSLNATYGPAGP